MKWIVIVSAVLLAVVALFAAATSPNPSDHRAATILIAVAAAFVVLALIAPPRITAIIYFASIALVVIAYKLPMSFWQSVGLADTTAEQGRPDPRDGTDG